MHIGIVLSAKTKTKRRRALAELPETLEKTFGAMIERLKKYSEDFELSFDVLTWIHLAQRPLMVVELQHALATEIISTTFDAENILSHAMILESCMGLVVIDHPYGHSGVGIAP
jgi:hypothetical protein